MSRAYNLLLVGGPGTGKTFIASGLVHEAVKEGYNAALISLEDLLVCLKTKDVSRHAMKTYERIMKARLLAIDNVTLYPLKREDMLLLFKWLTPFRKKCHSLLLRTGDWRSGWRNWEMKRWLLPYLTGCSTVVK